MKLQTKLGARGSVFFFRRFPWVDDHVFFGRSFEKEDNETFPSDLDGILTILTLDEFVNPLVEYGRYWGLQKKRDQLLY